MCESCRGAFIRMHPLRPGFQAGPPARIARALYDLVSQMRRCEIPWGANFRGPACGVRCHRSKRPPGRSAWNHDRATNHRASARNFQPRAAEALMPQSRAIPAIPRRQTQARSGAIIPKTMRSAQKTRQRGRNSLGRLAPSEREHADEIRYVLIQFTLPKEHGGHHQHGVFECLASQYLPTAPNLRPC